jgi:dephospho-CoA kinase
MLLGLTGAYCAGKNHVGALLENRGFSVLDVDKLGYLAIEREAAAIRARFGDRVLGPDGRVDRRLLGAHVFGDPEELAALERIVHPAANALTEAWIAERPGQKLAINAALLHKSTVFDRVDLIIVVRAPFLVRLLRAMRRDKLSIGKILARFRSQRDFATQYFRQNADTVIVDNGISFVSGSLERRIDSLLARKGIGR